MLILTDDEVRQAEAGDVVAFMRRALTLHHSGELAAPARAYTEATPALPGRLAFTVGADPDALGFRMYAVNHGLPVDQLTVVFDRGTGALAGLVQGSLLGSRRTGALGAVAADLLARPDATTLGLVGAGRQAFAHVWALRAVRRLTEVRVFSPTPERREAFARRVRDELGLPCTAVARAEDAVTGADLVTLATTPSPEPVIDAAWVAPGTHVATLRPSTIHGSEAPGELAARAGAIVTDSVAQLNGYADPAWPALAGRLDDVRELSAVVAGAAPGRTSAEEITVYSGVGLAGTDVLLAAELLRQATRAQPTGS